MAAKHKQEPAWDIIGESAAAACAARTSDATESHSAYTEVWSSLARSSCCGEVFQREGLLIVSADGKWPIMNSAFLSSPVVSEADLQHRISIAREYFGQKHRLWLFICFNEWLDEAIEAEQLLWANRVAYVQGCVGMQAKRLVAPRKPVPELVYRLVESEAERLEFTDINADSYGFSAEWRSDMAGWISQWPTSKLRLYLAYAGNEAVSSAMVQLVGDAAVLAFVATRQGHQRKGYGEAITRYALANAEKEWCFSKTILHATPSGLPLYRNLGFSEVTDFGIYLGGYE